MAAKANNVVINHEVFIESKKNPNERMCQDNHPLKDNSLPPA